MKVVAL